MISPEVARAVAALEQRGLLAPEQSRLFSRIARGELVSLAGPLRALLYLGVLCLTSGVGLILKEQFWALGPVTIASLVLTLALLCLVWVHRISPAFSRRAVPSPHFAFDYILMLGALLLAADLGFIESRFATLGEAWPLHLLLVSLVYSAFAFRYDSRGLFTLSLTTFAAWRGVAAVSLERAVLAVLGETGSVRMNALVCGVLFVILGRLLLHKDVKAHFEPPAVHLGFLLILQSIGWGIEAFPDRFLLGLAGAGLAAWAWRESRFTLFVFGVLAAYLSGVTTFALLIGEPYFITLATTGSALSLIFGLIAVHQRFRKEASE